MEVRYKNAKEVPVKLLCDYNMIAHATCSKGVIREDFKALNDHAYIIA